MVSKTYIGRRRFVAGTAAVQGEFPISVEASWQATGLQAKKDAVLLVRGAPGARPYRDFADT